MVVRGSGTVLGLRMVIGWVLPELARRGGVRRPSRFEHQGQRCVAHGACGLQKPEPDTYLMLLLD